MNNMTDNARVKEQYQNSGNLSTRISIHERYSVNKMGFGNWIFSHYGDLSGLRVLELGCGNGNMWRGHEDAISSADEIILSDFSEGMLASAKELLGDRNNLTYKVIDIQDIPFENGSFDLVIANMMLYHVPDIHKGLDEVCRVLRKGGTFCCATYGEHGIPEYISELLKDSTFRDNANRNFTLQNGMDILCPHFAQVARLDYEDALEVTVTGDLADYIFSLTSMAEVNLPREELINKLNMQKQDGIIRVPKEYGMFVCKI